MKRKMVIIGNGGMAREIRWVVEDINKSTDSWRILGWVSKEDPGTMIEGLPVLGDDDWLAAYDEPVDVVLGVGSGLLRKSIVSRIETNKNISFPTIIARSAEVSDYVRMGKGIVVMNKSLLTVNIEVGDFFLCNYGCTVGHDCVIGDYVTLNPGAHISGGVSFGECATVGVGSSVLQGLNIGRNSFVGAGAAVIRNVDDDSVVVGVPAKAISKN